MRLDQAEPESVVKNAGNGSFYRFGRPDRGRARIRPLELFPNGRLIAKPADTLVDASLDVLMVGPWREGMLVEGSPTRSRERYEAELEARLVDLAELEAAYEKLPVNGVGHQSRGSWANKVVSCRRRIEAIRLGLEDLGAVERQAAEAEATGPGLGARDVVLLPSGMPGLVLRTYATSGGRYARVRARVEHPRPGVLELPVPLELLRPWGDRQLCTL